MFIVNYIDCVNVGFVDCYFEVLIGIGVVVYGFGVGLFFVGYVLFEVLLNLLMQCYGVCVWLVWIMVMWGIVVVVMVFVWNDMLFYMLCFLFGVVEVGFFFGVVLYLL